VAAGVEPAGVLGLLSLEAAALLSFALPRESDFESDFESAFDSDLAVDSELDSEPDELLSDELLLAA